MATINGEKFDEKITITEYLKRENLSKERVAVMINGEILPKAEYDKKIISDTDEIEIVGFVGGG